MTPSTTSFRGGYAPRRGRGGWNKPFIKWTREHIKPDIQKNPLGYLLKTLNNSDLKMDSVTSFSDTPISDLQYIASYNWREEGLNTIIVPGSSKKQEIFHLYHEHHTGKPPYWTPLKQTQRLSEDSGQYYRDPNAARCPAYPIAPVVQSILNMNPRFPTTEIDVVACGSTLGNLLRFVRGQDKAFRIAVETIGNTVFFIRKENDPKEVIPDVRGYGHSFPEANTTWESEMKGSTTHQRIVRYKFGGLTCIVRFECDGYIKDEAIGSNGSTSKIDVSSADSDLVSAFSKAAIAQPLSSQNFSFSSLRVELGGAEVPPRFIFDLNTRSGRYKIDIDMSDIYPQLWIKQVPDFIVAYHDGAGLFGDVRVQDVRQDVKDWARDNIVAIQRLAALLQMIAKFARDDKGLLKLYSPHRLFRVPEAVWSGYPCTT
jgi:hypothetical protein